MTQRGSSSEELIERKLILDGEGTGEYKKLNTLTNYSAKWLLHTDGARNVETEYMNITALVNTFENNRKKSLLVSKSQKEELNKCKKTTGEYNECIEKVNEKIMQKSEALRKARILRQNRMRYSLLAKSIKEQPSRRMTQGRINNLKQEIGNLEKEKLELSDTWNKGIKQFRIISTSSNYIQSLIKEEQSSVIQSNNSN